MIGNDVDTTAAKKQQTDESREIPVRTAIEEKRIEGIQHESRESRRGSADGRSRSRAVMSEKEGSSKGKLTQHSGARHFGRLCWPSCRKVGNRWGMDEETVVKGKRKENERG